MAELAPPARAFDSIADSFDSRFTPWLSVAAQRRAVREELLKAFAPGASLIDIGGGTGEDAAWLLRRGREVLLTDPAPRMVAAASAKLGERRARVAEAEHLESLERSDGLFDGAYSNFAALNCVRDLNAFARGLAGILRPGAPVLLVLFGTFCPAEMVVEVAHGRWRNVFRRRARGDAPARLGGEHFSIRYHTASALRSAMSPWFEYRSRTAIGLFVPPSAAEPWISRHPRVLAALERWDRPLAGPLAMLGDHVLYRFERTEAPADR